MVIETLLRVVVFAFPLSEATLGILKRARREESAIEDRGSQRLLWIVILTSVALAILARGFPSARMHLPASLRQVTVLILLVSGLGLRWSAILTLGRYFTTNIATRSDQVLVQSGPYRYLRHPSYAGLLLAFLGLGVYFGNWLSIAILMVPITGSILHRMRLEESVLMARFGEQYAAYCARTRRLIPGIY